MTRMPSKLWQMDVQPVSYFFFKVYGYQGQFTCQFFWGGAVRTCADLGAEGLEEPREPRARGPRRKWWMLNPLSVHWCWSCLWTGFMQHSYLLYSELVQNKLCSSKKDSINCKKIIFRLIQYTIGNVQKMCGKIYSLLWTIQIYLSNVPHIYQQKI